MEYINKLRDLLPFLNGSNFKINHPALDALAFELQFDALAVGYSPFMIKVVEVESLDAITAIREVAKAKELDVSLLNAVGELVRTYTLSALTITTCNLVLNAAVNKTAVYEVVGTAQVLEKQDTTL